MDRYKNFYIKTVVMVIALSLKLAFPALVNPTNIIINPRACVNISLRPGISDKIIAIRLLSHKNNFKELIWSDNYTLAEINYYYSRYINNVGDNWVSLCDADHIIADHYLQFEVKKDLKIRFYPSSLIKLAFCKYVSDCHKDILSSNDHIIISDTFIGFTQQNVNVDLDFPVSLIPKFLRFSVCCYFENCVHVNLSDSDIYYKNIYNNLFIFKVNEERFDIQIKNQKLSRSTLHILYYANDKINLLTTTFHFMRDNVEFEEKKNSVQYKITPNLMVVKTTVTFIDNTIDEWVKINLGKSAYDYYSNFKFKKNRIEWSKFENISYSIVYIDYEFCRSGISFVETYLIIVDFDWHRDDNSIKKKVDYHKNFSIPHNMTQKFKLHYILLIFFIFLVVFSGVIYIILNERYYKIYGNFNLKFNYGKENGYINKN